ncbi:MAG: OprD family outer membrane porin [Pseudomonadota bacterium]|nr:OprD family outer membrane porin [Pseudomonadota bacterium]
MKFRIPGIMACTLAGLFTAVTSYANSFSSAIDSGKVSGYLRAYEWSNSNRYFSSTNNNTFVIGGKLKAESGVVDHFSAGAAFYTAHSPGLSSNPNQSEPTLGTDIDTLGEAYLNYHNQSVNVRLGRQKIETPFANSADYRMIPALYEGATLNFLATHDLSFTFGRITRYKSWTDNTFNRTNNETAGPFTKFPGIVNNGFWYAGIHDSLNQQTRTLTSQGWYYDFSNIAHLAFIDEKLALKETKSFNPFVGLQYVNEKSEGQELFGKVDARAYGINIGGSFSQDSLSLGAIHIPAKIGTFNNGGLASPYTDGYGSAALYTGNMLLPTEGLGSGNAYVVSGSHVFNSQWSGWAAYNRFNQTSSNSPVQPINEYVISLTFLPEGYFKGVKLNDMLGYATSSGNSHHFIQNRLMAQYDF